MPECLANEILVYGSLREADGGSPDVLGLVWVIQTDDFDVESVVRYRLVERGAQRA